MGYQTHAQRAKDAGITARIEPSDAAFLISIPDATPALVRAYSFDDAQALLAIIRCNRLIDNFLGLTTISLQNNLRVTVTGVGQIEIDELYLGFDKRSYRFVVPVQAKGENDQIGVMQMSQDIAYVEQRFLGFRCRAVTAQFTSNDTVALFELSLRNHKLQVVEERHYRLAQPGEATSCKYDS